MEIATVLGISHDNARALHSRALRFLKARLTALGRSPTTREKPRMRRCGRQALVLRSRRYALFQ